MKIPQRSPLIEILKPARLAPTIMHVHMSKLLVKPEKSETLDMLLQAYRNEAVKH